MERLTATLAARVRPNRVAPPARVEGLAEDERRRTSGWGSKHYHGHRERLRQRFLRRQRALADYELLELLLFFSIYRRDTKPIAKDLIEASAAFAACWLPSRRAMPNASARAARRARIAANPR